ncbi:hypothetical protein [Pontibacter liquoris]|uniref:hypothetical protein n=1 Tax=Pontibacter liquoris TaxID=2905677 RepID=UPI001FA6D192|nr:hypothetical protein [Pontibacter liquoris]
MNKLAHHYSSNKNLSLMLDITLITIAFKISDVYQGDYQYSLFFLLFALAWGVVSRFTSFIFRIDSFVSCGKEVANLINAFLLHGVLLGSSIVIFDFANIAGLPLLYTYLTTALLIMLSRVLLLQVFSYFSNSHMA